MDRPNSSGSHFDASSDPSSGESSGEGSHNDSGSASGWDPDHHLSESSCTPADQSGDPPRPFLGIRFQCCQTYGRIYRDGNKMAYEGRCPKCFAHVSVPIGEGGTSSRFFNVG